jgi:hypothetical protein
LVIAADAADATQMKGVVKQSTDRLGAIHGVIHAAGVFSGGIVQLRTREMVEQVFAPKIKGTRTLANLFSRARLDFFVLCSSLTAILGGQGRVDYCAANAFLDAFANHCNREDDERLTVSINWDTWQSVGMAANASPHIGIRAEREARLEMGIAPREGIDAFSRILGASLPQVLISTRELGQRLKLQPDDLHGATDPNQFEASASTNEHPRPELPNQYVAPKTEVEKKLARIWRAVLGIEEVGTHDDFFELGGHSLLATQVVSRARAQSVFQMDLPLRVLFDKKTIHELAKAISDVRNDTFSEEIA